MSNIGDQDHYIKLTNIEDGIARFTLYKNKKAIRGFNERIENVPDEYDIGDYFSTQINSEDLDETDLNLENLNFDPELTKKKRKENEEVIDEFKRLQSSAEKELKE
ncbi:MULTISPECIES: hypothetical protein [unclassified Natrinema]|uniref:hypothetical protein n=1 Tax=unclassified Natrinema TaxID=2622230 RepID=UPI00026D501D|nr:MULTISPECIES: hypothetical protein [unclassified Natrinema]AFO59475.1 hypothetical protein NJ7G_4260 [Natrinema sp. J7-2]